MVYGSVFGNVTEGTIDPKYAAPNGALDAITEAIELDQAMFNAFVERDFNEVMSQYNPVMAESYDVLNEGFLGDVWNKILTILKKIKDKVVSIMKAAAIRIGAFFTRDNAELVRKYMKQFDAAVKKGVDLEIKDYVDPEKSMEAIHGLNAQIAMTSILMSGLKVTTKEDAERFVEDLEEKLIHACGINASTVKELKGNAYDISKYTSTAKVNPATVKQFLTDSKSEIDAINHTKDSILKDIKESENCVKEAMNSAKKMDDGEDKDNALAIANAGQKCVTLMQKITVAICNAAIATVKVVIKSNRKAFITIAVRGTKNGEKASKDVDEKKTKDGTAAQDESYLLQAELDNQDYVVESAFEEYIPDEYLVA